MSEQRYDQTKVSEYREAATKLHEALLTVEQRLDAAFENGINQDVHDALAELNASGVELEKLRLTLTPTDLFIAKYNIQVHGSHEVSFVLPTGVSRYEMLSEAQRVVTERDLVWPNDLKKWEKNPKFTDACTTPERIQIDGHVEGGDWKTKAEQVTLLKTKGLPLASLEDLAGAFVVFYVATGEPLFGWYNKSYGQSFAVRAAGGELSFDSSGLYVRDIAVGNGFRELAVAARVPGKSEN